MKMRKCTCPLTGITFDAIMDEHEMIVTNPLTEKAITFSINHGFVQIPISMFKSVPLLTPTATAYELGVTRQRVDQLSKTNKLTPHYIANTLMFIKDEVLEYKKQRKNGRPKKE